MMSSIQANASNLVNTTLSSLVTTSSHIYTFNEGKSFCCICVHKCAVVVLVVIGELGSIVGVCHNKISNAMVYVNSQERVKIRR